MEEVRGKSVDGGGGGDGGGVRSGFRWVGEGIELGVAGSRWKGMEK
jgi:hypothetical protein